MCGNIFYKEDCNIIVLKSIDDLKSVICIWHIESEVIFMTHKIVKELKKIECNKRCGLLTCVHYAGGYCVGCENEGECEFIEKSSTQD